MSRRARRHHGTSWPLALALMVGAVAIGAVVAELALRIAMPSWREFHAGWFMVRVVQPGLAAVTTGRPGFDGWFSQNNGDFRSHVRINAFGLRNDEPVEAADGRIWVIGDSMSFGWGVQRDETYTQVVGDRLGIPGYNVAGPGSNVCGWQTLYARMPRTVHPAAVVVGLTIENRMDVYDCKTAALATLAPVADDGGGSGFIGFKQWLTGHFALYNFFAVSLKRVGGLDTLLERAGLIQSPDSAGLHGQDPSQMADMIRTTADELDRLKAMVAADAPVPFVVAVIPARHELRDGFAYSRDMRQGALAALAERGIDTVDLFEPLMKAGLGPTHFAHDGHWSALGHRIAGEAIARWFKDRDLPPRSAKP